MPNVMDAFEHLNGLTETQLFARRAALISASPNGDFKDLSDEVLQELVAIHRILRRKTSSTPRVSVGRKAIVPSLDIL